MRDHSVDQCKKLLLNTRNVILNLHRDINDLYLFVPLKLRLITLSFDLNVREILLAWCITLKLIVL